MEPALQFLQSYGPAIVLGGAVLFLMTRRGGGMGCCGGGQPGASCHQQPASAAAPESASRPATQAELQAELVELRARQDEIARRVEALAAEPAPADGPKPVLAAPPRAAERSATDRTRPSERRE